MFVARLAGARWCVHERILGAEEAHGARLRAPRCHAHDDGVAERGARHVAGWRRRRRLPLRAL